VRLFGNQPASKSFEGYGLHRYADDALLASFDLIRHVDFDLPIIPEVKFDVMNATHLSSTIQQILKLGFEEVHLRPLNEFSATVIKALRKIYLELQLNVDLKRNRVNLSPLLPVAKAWSINTLSSQGYLRHLHIDLSNKCTHSCNFCGLYANEAMRLNRQKNGKLHPEIVQVMKQEADGERIQKLIDELPWSVEFVQFGGVGDPLLHSKAVDLIVAARERGIHVEVLSNLEYLDDQQVDRISEVGNHCSPSVNIVVNISGPDEETYLKTRPRQTAKNFERVIRNLERFADFRKSRGYGVELVLMQVVTNENYRSVVDMAQLAVRFGAKSVFFKPLEIHSPFMRDQALNLEQRQECLELLEVARHLAKSAGVEIKGEKNLFAAELQQENRSSANGSLRSASANL
jgi:MoaA/NifB/PqqE/SkfB family radical SAM enzyme